LGRDGGGRACFGYEPVMKERAVMIHGMLIRLTAFSIRLAPRKLLAAIVQRLHESMP